MGHLEHTHCKNRLLFALRFKSIKVILQIWSLWMFLMMQVNEGSVECIQQTPLLCIAHCKNVRGLGRVSYSDWNVAEWKATQPSLRVFRRKIVQMGTLQKLQIPGKQTLIILWPVYLIHANSLFYVIFEEPCHFPPLNTWIRFSN